MWRLVVETFPWSVIDLFDYEFRGAKGDRLLFPSGVPKVACPLFSFRKWEKEAAQGLPKVASLLSLSSNVELLCGYFA